ncbi:uncharacterized protein LOC124644034 [Helicoverpa zea]|uniref:uncharacterized protein LOC124644034 n=1 Tax=Helicoverpa zea TaxID=7113 RepID=UPI001F56653B|nr:uncharacterized protein LOC124644034 [Helicoverpa zea]
MPNHKNNLFLDKFSLLNSQENTEDIKWSSSSSSDYENTSFSNKLGNNNKTCSKKRKRKKKVPKNMSNLDITIVDSCNDRKKECFREKSPILVTKSVESPVSPILMSSCKFPRNRPTSPILTQKSLQQRSPILMPRTTSPKYTIKVRKKLDYKEHKSKKNDFKSIDSNQEAFGDDKILNMKTELQSFDNSLEINTTTSDKSESSLQAKLKLIKSVKNYFDSHFSSENTSQNISDTPTPEESSKNESIEILTCKTQVPNLQIIKQDSTSNSDTSIYMQKNKKIKCKKGGLAHRLNALLKKQQAHVSLWQHERFLAGTSNFVIPKGEHAVFFIQNIDFKYGCYLLNAFDVKDEKYAIFINSSSVNNNIIADAVLKLFEPYKILTLDDKDFKIIINVSKFECFDLKNS